MAQWSYLPQELKAADATTLMFNDPGLGGPSPPRHDPRRPLELRRRQSAQRRAVLLGLALAALIAIVAVALDRWGPDVARSDTARSAADSPLRIQLPPADPVIFETAVLPITPEDAKALNDKRPNDIARAIPAVPFVIAGADLDSPQYAAALQCLAQAVYYEAASESDEGQRAVAQVILNRVRHPAFPHTVCGAVYQGSERQTGCQFTFTCDGSLARVPSPAGMARARRVAADALSGRVADTVGLATHYHADHVVPYWAASLAKVEQIGAHIFYNLRGPLGSPRAFQARYDLAREPFTAPLPPLSEMADLTEAGENEAGQPDISSLGAPVPLAEDIRAGRLLPEASDLATTTAVLPPLLRADQEAGSLAAKNGGALLADERRPAADNPSLQQGDR